MIERSCAFLRREVKEGRLRVIREENRVGLQRREGNERREWRYEGCLDLRDLYMRENLVFDSLIFLEPRERFKNRSNVMKFSSLVSTSTTHT